VVWEAKLGDGEMVGGRMRCNGPRLKADGEALWSAYERQGGGSTDKAEDSLYQLIEEGNRVRV
jgi:hypothetical protein